MRRTIAVAIAIIVPVLAAHADQQFSMSSVWKTLHAAEPRVQWDLPTARRADVTCDGQMDVLVIGRGKDGAVWLGAVLSERRASSNPQVMEFGTVEMAFCGEPAHIEIHDAACEDEGEGVFDDCVATRSCRQLSLRGGACDAYHFFWNGKKRELNWWRR